MGEKIGAEVQSGRAPLKYEGLSYTEIWISEAQERMVLAVPEDRWPELEQLCRSENVEATVIGRFVPTGRLQLQLRRQAGGRSGHAVFARRPAAGGAQGRCISRRPTAMPTSPESEMPQSETANYTD